MHLPLSLLLLTLNILPSLSASVIAPDEQFEEKLTLRPLPDGKVHAHFRFLTTVLDPEPGVPFLSTPAEAPLHATLLPLSLTQLLRTYHTPELHLSLNAGKWDYTRWGQPSTAALRTGAEMWAWIADDRGAEQKRESERWQGLTNGLAGLFCASLSSQIEQRTTSPRLAFRPEGDLPSHTPHKLYHASHPSESVCTENLTPFLKLLPCKSRAGIAQLLNPHRIFDADFHGMGVHVQYHAGPSPAPAEDGKGGGDVGRGWTEMILEVNAVFDTVRLSREGKRDWSLYSLFERHITRSCHAARKSELGVLLPEGGEDVHELTPQPALMRADGEMFEALYDLGDVREEVNVGMRWLEDKFDYGKARFTPPDLSIRRSLKGSSGLAELSVILTNTLDVPRRVPYVETLPWFISLFLHTMKTEVDGLVRDDIIQSISYLPPVSPKPTLLELTLLLPPQSQMHLTMQVEKGFIRYTEHQPDANRGWDLPAAVVYPLPLSSAINSTSPTHVSGGAGNGKTEQRIYSGTILVDLPTPDFSMPYNVIIMSSTLIALFFGSVFNCLTRRFVVLKVGTEEGEVEVNVKTEKGKSRAS